MSVRSKEECWPGMAESSFTFLLLIAAITTIAFLYSSVGHAGASGYIAILTLIGWDSEEIRLLALTLNVGVALIATAQFFSAGFFRRHLFFNLVIFSVPCAALGAYLPLVGKPLDLLLSITLLLSAGWMGTHRRRENESIHAPSTPIAMTVGAALGFLAGATGTGGGVFLSPLMYLLRWGSIKEISAIAAPYILVNSLAGLTGAYHGGGHLPAAWPWFVIAAIGGGCVGSALGARALNPTIVKNLLATVVAIAGVKLLLK